MLRQERSKLRCLSPYMTPIGNDWRSRNEKNFPWCQLRVFAEWWLCELLQDRWAIYLCFYEKRWMPGLLPSPPPPIHISRVLFITHLRLITVLMTGRSNSFVVSCRRWTPWCICGDAPMNVNHGTMASYEFGEIREAQGYAPHGVDSNSVD